MKEMQFVGFAGHRAVPDRAAAKMAILRELELILSGLHGEFAGSASAAAGADLLFLDASRELGMKTIILLPFSIGQAIADFEAHWESDPPQAATSDPVFDDLPPVADGRPRGTPTSTSARMARFATSGPWAI